MKKEFKLIKINKLLILKEVNPIWKNRIAKCLCDCWTIKNIRYQNVIHWYVKSCGCLQLRTTHWLSYSKMYSKYQSLKHRCNNPTNKHYHRYGGRWIKCLWNSFEEFYNDMKDTYEDWLTIERDNVNWHYSKSNCSWKTMKEQNRNKENTIYYKWKCIWEWIEELWLSPDKVYWRIKHNWTIEKALELI